MATTNVLTNYQKYLIDNKEEIIINEILIINDNKKEIHEEFMKRIEFIGYAKRLGFLKSFQKFKLLINIAYCMRESSFILINTCKSASSL